MIHSKDRCAVRKAEEVAAHDHALVKQHNTLQNLALLLQEHSPS
jgi:hypothetical protein